MKKYSLFLSLAFFLSFSVSAADALLQRFVELAPEGVTLHEAGEAEGIITLNGAADANGQIAMFMQLLERKDIGTVFLKQVRRENDQSHFILLIGG